MQILGKEKGSSIELSIVDNAMHGFDDPAVGEKSYYEKTWNPNKTPTFGVTYGYNSVAAENAAKSVKEYLGKM